MSALLGRYPQGVRRQTLRKGRCAAAGNPPAYPLRVLRQDRLQGECLAAYPLRVLAFQAVLALCLLFALPAPAAADTLHGVVIVVIDGDTLLFKPDHYHPSSRAFLKVRLADIDAPEQGQPHGEAATRALREMALKQRATLDIVASDRYGRKLGQLKVGTLGVNAELVRRGDAWSSSRAAGNPLHSLEGEAQQARRGLWADAAPMPPWAWRRAQLVPAP